MPTVKYPKEKIILTDVDGCLVDWNRSFHKWMKSSYYSRVRGHLPLIEDQYDLPTSKIRRLIRDFNESDSISNLEPFNDSQYYIKKLYKLDYRFVCITSIGLTENIKNNRIKNLKNLFGYDTFLHFEFLKTYESKEEILKQYREIGKYWIEDNFKQYTFGVTQGFKSFYLTSDLSPECVNSWKEIYNRILKDVSI